MNTSQEDTIRTLLQNGFKRLSFEDPTLESQYKRFYFDRHFQSAIMPLCIGLMLYLGFIIPDSVIIPQLLDKSILLRLIITVPGIFFLAFMKWGPKSYYQYFVVSLMMCVTNLSIALLGYWAAHQGQHYYQSGSLLVIMLTCTLAKLPFLYALFSTAVMIVSYILIIGLTAASPADIFMNNLFIFLGVAFFGLVSNYHHHIEVRRNYLQDRLLSAEKVSLSKEKDRFEHISNIDELTGLYNRRFFDQEYSTLWAQAYNQQTPISVLMIDIDHFKQLNDQLGHHKGDEILIQVSSYLQDSVRKSSDVVARYGGEEFILVCPSLDKTESMNLAEKLRQGIDQLAIPHPAADNLTISIGVACCTPTNTDKEAQEQLQKLADSALYRAKEMGRNQAACA